MKRVLQLQIVFQQSGKKIQSRMKTLWLCQRSRARGPHPGSRRVALYHTGLKRVNLNLYRTLQVLYSGTVVNSPNNSVVELSTSKNKVKKSGPRAREVSAKPGYFVQQVFSTRTFVRAVYVPYTYPGVRTSDSKVSMTVV